jgi:4-phytase/acid phosphatase
MGCNGAQGDHLLLGKAFRLGRAALHFVCIAAERNGITRARDKRYVVFQVDLGADMAWGRSYLHRARLRAARGAFMRLTSIVLALWLVQLAAAQLALAAPTAAARDTIVKVVILSRHGVRSPIPSQDELDTWTASTWPVWNCAIPPTVKVCASGQLTPRGATLAEQMGMFYRTYLAGLLPPDQCPTPDSVFVWADRTERTEQTGLALLRGFRPSCTSEKYFHTASPALTDRIFHPVMGSGRCTLDAGRAEHEILARAGGNLSTIESSLAGELGIAQKTLQCCQSRLCFSAANSCRLPTPSAKMCTLNDRLATCVVPHPSTGKPTDVLLGGSLRVASTFAELLLLEYANGFAQKEVGWGRISRQEMARLFRLHTTAFDLEQRTSYIAKRQGSALVKKILFALEDKNDGQPGTAPPDAKFVAYVGHDTNISNVAGMLGLSWQQPGYQQDQTPPTGALVFELHQTSPGSRYVSAFYVAQSLDDMRNVSGTAPQRAAVPILGCSDESRCPLGNFVQLATHALDPQCED